MISGIHFLLSYKCNSACDHCFLYSSPSSKGTMTTDQIKTVLEEAEKLGSVEMIYWEGGEPFLFYSLLLEGINLANEMGFKSGIVSNGYWAASVKRAKEKLKPIVRLGVSSLSISCDEFHYDNIDYNSAKTARTAAEELKIPSHYISMSKPKPDPEQDPSKGKPIIGGGIKLRGRAAVKYGESLPKRKISELNECPYEDLLNPNRVHVDAYGNVQICQGISIGNYLKTPLTKLITEYDGMNHPICGPLKRKGPIGLVEEHYLQMKDEYADECHLCYSARLQLIEKYPEELAPGQVYGI